MADIGPLSPEELLARSAAAVKSGNTSKPKSAVEKLLAQRDEPLEDVADISPVAKLLAQQEKSAKKIVNYFESDEYLRQKVSQLRGQLAIYTTLPGLDPSGAVVDGIEKEIKDLLKKQNATLQETLKKSKEAEAKLEEQKKLDALKLPSPKELLEKLQGTAKPDPLSKEVQALLDKSKKAVSVNTTA